MDIKQQSIIKNLNAGGKLPTPKGIALELIRLTSQEEYSSADVIKLIGSDPALSVSTLKAANAMLLGLHHSVVSISDAIAILGVRTLRLLVLSIAIVHDNKHGPCKQYDYEYFWSCSLLTGIAMRHLAQEAKVASADELFVVGLLSEIGELAIASAYPEQFGSMLASTNKTEITNFLAVEKSVFGFDHAEASAAIMTELSFPELFRRMAHQFQLLDLDDWTEGSREWKLLKMLQVSSLIARISLALPSQRLRLVEALKIKAAEVAVEEKEIIKIAEICSNNWPKWTALFNLPSRTIPSFAELFDELEATALNVNVTPQIYSTQDYTLRVLVVDDDRLMLSLLSNMLNSVGHKVITATNGIEALQKIESEHPQLVITDWQMPLMDGITLCREIRERFKNRPLYITVVTSHESAERLVEAFEAGADDYLVKPIIPKILYARMRAAQRVIKLQEALANDREQMVRFSIELSETNAQLQHQSQTDALTELPNRRMAMGRLEQEWKLSERSHLPLSCLMLDVDHFKSINDNHGHQVGDQALQFISKILQRVSRTTDLVCRYGGEEFLVVCPNTSLDQAHQLAERMRLEIAAQHLLTHDHIKLQLTVSIGIAEKLTSTGTQDDLLKSADVHMYEAKRAGRNCTRGA